MYAGGRVSAARDPDVMDFVRFMDFLGFGILSLFSLLDLGFSLLFTSPQTGDLDAVALSIFPPKFLVIFFTCGYAQLIINLNLMRWWTRFIVKI